MRSIGCVGPVAACVVSVRTARVRRASLFRQGAWRQLICLITQQGGFGGFTAYSGCNSSTATWRVLAGRDNQAILDKHPFDYPRLYPGHRSRGVGHSEVLNGP